MLVIAVNKVNGKNSQIFKESDQFSTKNSPFQGASSALEMKFHIQALFKEIKDLHESCKVKGMAFKKNIY